MLDVLAQVTELGNSQVQGMSRIPVRGRQNVWGLGINRSLGIVERASARDIKRKIIIGS